MRWRCFRLVAFLLVFLVPGVTHARKMKTQYLHHGPITVEMRYDPRGPKADPDIPPVVTVFYLKKKVARLVLENSVGKPDVFIAQMDPANRAKEVVVEGYSGGAHCCEEIYVLTALPRRETRPWKKIYLGSFDGGWVKPQDLDGDGLAELELKDDRFLYLHGCYACSYAPPLFLSVRNGKKVNLTRSDGFQQVLWLEVRELEKRIRQPEEELSEEALNSLLAGYVALKSLLGDGADAWRFMLKHHKPQPMSHCPMPNPKGGKCPVPEMEISFPLHLSIFLRETGYTRMH